LIVRYHITTLNKIFIETQFSLFIVYKLHKALT